MIEQSFGTMLYPRQVDLTFKNVDMIALPKLVFKQCRKFKGISNFTNPLGVLEPGSRLHC